MVRLEPVWMTNHLLQCFDAVGWVIRPVKTVGRITYIVLVQMLNHAQSINQAVVNFAAYSLQLSPQY